MTWWAAAASAMVPAMDQEILSPPGEVWEEIVAGDFDGDGDGDVLLTTSHAGVAQVLLEGGPGGLATVGSAAGGGGRQLLALDANGDGVDDWAEFSCPTPYAGSFSLYLGGPVPAVAPSQTVTTSGCDQRAKGDFNGDGRDDLAILPSGIVRVFHGNPAGLYTVANLTYGFAEGVGAGDLDGDGFDDLILVQAYDTVDILRGRRIGLEYWVGWTIRTALNRHAAAAEVVTGRGNGDRYDDLLLTTETPWVGGSYGEVAFVGSATGPSSVGFEPPPLQCGGTMPLLAVVPDQDGDGKDEILVACPDSTNDLRFVSNNLVVDTHVGEVVDLGVGDLDGDGFPDRIALEDVGGGRSAIAIDYGP